MILGTEPVGWLSRRLARAVVFAALSVIPILTDGETLSLTKQGPGTAREGDLIEYRLEVVNAGTAGLVGVQVRDTLPEAVDFVQAVSTPGGTFDPATGLWTLPPLGTDAANSAAELQLQALVRDSLLADPSDTVAAVNSAAVVAPELPAPIAAQLTTHVVCGFCIDWEILSVGLNTEHRSRLPDVRETRFFLAVQVANNGPVASDGSVSATRFDVSGGDFRPALSLEPALPVPVSLAAGATQTISFVTNWAEGPFSTYTLSWEFAISDQSLLDPVLPNTLAGSWTGDASDRDDDNRCVVAVAASGSFLEPHLPGVRRFRDRTLLRSRLGQMLVAWYYEVSPSMAQRIAHNRTLRIVARIVLTPVLFAIATPMLVLCVLGGLLFLTFAYRKGQEQTRSILAWRRPAMRCLPHSSASLAS